MGHNIKVEILEPKGYCAGVERAIKLAIKARQDNPERDVYVLGMLVHNNYVVRYLEDKGIKTATKIEDIPNESVIIFSAHGHKVHYDALAKDKNLIVYDSTCPKVQSNLDLIKKYLEKGHQIIYIGQEGHPEAEACLSLSKNVILFHKNLLKNYQSISDPNPLIITQTTLNICDVKSVQTDLISVIPGAHVANEVCASTRLRQEAFSSIKERPDLILVVGDRNSSNTRRLLEVAKSTLPQVPSNLISSADELDDKLLANKKRIVISSGASTPLEIINAVSDKIKNY